ncbi:MAG: isoprenylcysteine carboxylmethyltransferase family protein [Pseudomonadota bacterium]|nr:isoprenylcysteine carboxylmethyltransferase family protein [Pseudomonadota bacterium]
MGAPLFLAAGSYDVPRIWTFLAAVLVFTVLNMAYMWKADPALLERRLQGHKGEVEKSQKSIRRIMNLLVLGLLIVAGLDIRNGWSHMALSYVAAGYVLFAGGLVVYLTVLRQNSFASSIIHVEHDQALITNGLYRHVRHPMYSGFILVFAGIPLALGSWWALLLALPLVALLIVRLTEEERVLLENLPGYGSYRQQTRRRLIPFIW